MFIVLLTIIDNAPNQTKCESLSNQKFEIQPTPINLHPNEYSQKLHYYPSAVKLDKCVASCNTVNGLSNKVCVPNKAEDLNVYVFNMVTGKNESKILTKVISSGCKYKLDRKKCNSNQKWNNDKCQCECEKHNICEKGYVCNIATCSSENGKYLASTIDNLVSTCDEIMEETVPKKFDEKK